MSTLSRNARVAIIGGGISGLAALHFLKQKLPAEAEIRLFESEKRLGGTVGSDRANGFVCDWGPNGFLDRVPLTLQLVAELGLNNKLRPADPQAEKRYIYRHGRLNAISASPIKFMASPLLSVRGRLRVLMEPFIKAKRDDSDESVFDFASRRIGREAAEAMIDPMVSGIFGGDARAVSLQSCFPTMAALERQYGSLFKALMAKRKSSKGAGPAGPAGRLTSFDNGLYTLIERFAELYGEMIESGRKVARITRREESYEVTFTTGDTSHWDTVIIATPAFAAAELVESLDSQLSQTLKVIPYASISVCCFGYDRAKVGRDFNGFGFLVPRHEGKRILGSIWTSSIFSDQAPADQILMRTMIGGYTDPDAASLPETELISLVDSELRGILGMQFAPDYVRIFRFEKGIPQFLLGHSERLMRIDSRLSLMPGLYLTGNAYNGIGLNDCVVKSNEVATLAARFLA